MTAKGYTEKSEENEDESVPVFLYPKSEKDMKFESIVGFAMQCLPYHLMDGIRCEVEFTVTTSSTTSSLGRTNTIPTDSWEANASSKVYARYLDKVRYNLQRIVKSTLLQAIFHVPSTFITNRIASNLYYYTTNNKDCNPSLHELDTELFLLRRKLIQAKFQLEQNRQHAFRIGQKFLSLKQRQKKQQQNLRIVSADSSFTKQQLGFTTANHTTRHDTNSQDTSLLANCNLPKNTIDESFNLATESPSMTLDNSISTFQEAEQPKPIEPLGLHLVSSEDGNRTLDVEERLQIALENSLILLRGLLAESEKKKSLSSNLPSEDTNTSTTTSKDKQEDAPTTSDSNRSRQRTRKRTSTDNNTHVPNDTPMTSAKRQQRYSSSSSQLTMNQRQLDLSKRLTIMFGYSHQGGKLLCSTESAKLMDTLIDETGLTKYRVEKFMEGDPGRLISHGQHTETEERLLEYINCRKLTTVSSSRAPLHTMTKGQFIFATTLKSRISSSTTTTTTTTMQPSTLKLPLLKPIHVDEMLLQTSISEYRFHKFLEGDPAQIIKPQHHCEVEERLIQFLKVLDNIV